MLIERLKQIRNVLNLNQIDFAKKIGMSQSTYANFESGIRSVKQEFLENLAEKYNINIHWLLTGKGEMFATPSLNIPQSTQNLLRHAISENISFDEVDSSLTHLLLTKSLQKIKEYKRNEGFFVKLFSEINDWQNTNNLRMLVVALDDARKINRDLSTVTPDNARAILAEIVENYQTSVILKLKAIITDAQKNEFVDFIKNHLDDIECFVVLKDLDVTIPAILDALERFVNVLPKSIK